MSTGNARDVGDIFIGLDFGMALTKVAAAVLPPKQRRPIRVVVELPDSQHAAGRAAHIPSGLWQSGDRLFAFREAAYRASAAPTSTPPKPAPRRSGLAGLGQMLLGFMRSEPETKLQSIASGHARPIEGLKAALLDEWDGKPLRSCAPLDAKPSELVMIKLTLVLAHAVSRLRQLAERKAPNSLWRIHVNCAVPLAGARAKESRVQAMKALVQRATQLAQGIKDPGLGVSVAELRNALDEIPSAEQSGAQIGVHVTIESLAAALFHLQADGQTEGNWLTVDVGGLTTDTTLFFCNPEYRHVSYYSTSSIHCGMDSFAQEVARLTGGTVAEAHARLATQAALPAMHGVDSSARRSAVVGVMKQTAASALRKAKPWQLFPTTSIDGRVQVQPNWRILLLGGGTVHPEVRSWIAEWKYGGPHGGDAISVQSCSVDNGRLPADTQLLGPDGALRSVAAATISRTDEAILALAVGLAQPSWEIWEYSEEDDRKPNYGKDWDGDRHYPDK